MESADRRLNTPAYWTCCVSLLNTGQNSQNPSEFLKFFREIQGDVAEEVKSVAEEGLERALECFFKGMGLRPSWSSSPVR